MAAAAPPAPAELTSSTVTIDSLPDGVLAEVMLRVPTPAALVHAAAVSKRWRGVIVTPNGKFLDDYRERHKSSPFLGLYIPRKYGGLPSFHKADSIQSADDDDDGSDPDLQRAADKAFRLDGLKRHGKWRLLDCYNGRLLLTRDDGCLVVYNPLSRERISVGLPQDGILRNDFSACLVQGHGDDASSFRVVSVQRHRGDRMVHAIEYDSRRKSWNHHQDGEILNKIEGTEQGEMMHAGNLIFCKYIGTSLLVLDTTNMQFSVLPLPADNNPKKYAIGEIEDGVCCLAAVDSVGASNTPYLRVWRLEKQDWMMEKVMEVQQVLGEHAPGGHLYYKVRKVVNGVAVLCWSMRDLHFIIDLKTFCVMGQFEFNNNLPAFPMQLPWPPAFLVATITVMNPAAAAAAALGGEAEGAKTDGKSDEEDTETGGENEDAAEDSNTECARRGEGKIEEESTETAGENEDAPKDSDTEGDAVEESPPSRRRRRKRADTPEDDEAEEEILAPLCHRHRRKLGEHGDSLPDHLRCSRRDGKKWRCSARALPTVSFCKYHYTKANKGKIKKVPADGEVLAVALQRLKNNSINPPVATISVMNPRSSEGAKIDFHRQRQSRKRGDSPPPPDHLRCGRRDGKKWRCSCRALPTVSFCEYHYAKAKMGKKLPADVEVFAVVRQRLKNKRKGGKNINPMVLPQATTSDCQTRDLLNGQMTISPSSSGPAAMPSPVTMKVGVEIPAPIQRCYRSNNAEPLPDGPVKGAPCEMSMTKAVPRTSHHCGLTKAAGVANCKNCENNFCNSCINKWYSGISRKDIKTCCPGCRGLCDCKKCALGQTKGAMRKQ